MNLDFVSYRSRNHTYDTLIKTSKGTSEGSGGEPWGACCHSLRVAAVRGWPRSAGGRGLGWLWSAVGFGPRVAVVCEWPRSAGGHSPRVVVVWGGRGLGWPWSASGRGLEWPWSAVGFGPPVAAVCGSPGARRRPVRGADVGAESSFALSCASPWRVCLAGARPRPAGDS